MSSFVCTGTEMDGYCDFPPTEADVDNKIKILLLLWIDTDGKNPYYSLINF